MSASDWRKDYDITLDGTEEKNEKECFKLKMIPKDEDDSYSKVYFWVDKTNYFGVGAEYYDEDEELWKVLILKDVEKIGAYWTPKHIEMKNVQKGSRTEMIMDKIEYDIELDVKMFSERYLKK